MSNNDDKEQELFDSLEGKIIGRKDKIVTSGQEEYGRGFTKARPNIDVISKRNEEEEKRQRNKSYITTGIVVLVIMAVMFLIYLFS